MSGTCRLADAARERVLRWIGRGRSIRQGLSTGASPQGGRSRHSFGVAILSLPDVHPPATRGRGKARRGRLRQARAGVVAAATAAAAVLSLALTEPAAAEEARRPIEVRRASGPIVVDGRLDDAGWRDAAALDTFVEARPGDNIEPHVHTILRLVYDDRFLYVSFDCEDPEPSRIRSYLSDRDDVGAEQDYACVFLDTRHDGRTLTEFCANPRGVQYDSVQDDATGVEDASPDFYWEAAGRVDARGWTLEIRIPFSTLRYGRGDPQTWGLIAMRNYTREDRHMLFTSPMPRGSPCFACHERDLVGLSGLPSGSHFVVAPYGSVREEARSSTPGGPLEKGPVRADGGLDLKWTPGADTAIDGTFRPDFSQIESDVAQISANTRFALFYPEKRPFFLEGSELFRTPIQAIYTRTLTSPGWGARVTGKAGDDAYTLLAANDRGGGTLILPGPQGSSSVPQDFESLAVIGRLRHDIGSSFASLLFTDREQRGGGYNRVVGPDFQWVPNHEDRVTGQFLISETRGAPVAGETREPGPTADHALDVSWNHGTSRLGWLLEYADLGERFRADDGFVPQVGYRRGFAQLVARFNESGVFTQLAPVLVEDYSADRRGRVLLARSYPGLRFVGTAASSGEMDVFFDRVRVGDRVFDRRQLSFQLAATPAEFLPTFSAAGFWGEDVDVENVRRGHGGEIDLAASVRAGPALVVDLTVSKRWLDVSAGGQSRRLFAAQVDRFKATYSFDARSFLRAILEYQATDRTPALYTASVLRHDGGLTASALFAYKLNWQTVFFVGYGDDRLRDERAMLEQSDRQWFLKASYAFGR